MATLLHLERNTDLLVRLMQHLECGLTEEDLRAIAGAPAAVTQRLNAIFVKVSNSPEAKAFQANTSGETATSTPEGLARFQAAESQKWGRVIQAAGIQPE